jgi:uncharacterized protein involved in outer membrane biogenesis
MRIFLRILAIAVAVVVVLLVAVAIAVSTIDVNSFVSPIQARVKQETGRDLAIRGGIDLKLSLEPKLVVSDVTLGNPKWAKAPAMITAKKVEAQVALLPLLQRRFEIIRFTLIEPTIALETDSQGQRNWDFGRGATASAPAGSPNASADALAALGVGSIEVEKGTLTYRDGASGKTTNVAIDRLLLSSRTRNAPVNAEFRGNVDGVAIAVTGNLGPLDTLAQRKWPYPITLEGDVNGKSTSVTTKLHAKDDAIGLDDVAVAFGPSRATGEVTIATGGARPSITFKIAAPAFSFADLPIPARAADVAAKASTPSTPSRWVFDDRPVSLAPMRSFDADGEIAIDRLLLPEGRHVDNVRAKVALRGGVLDIPSAQLTTFGGTTAIKLHVDATRDPDNAVTLAVDGKGLDLGAIALEAGVPRDIKGGKTDVTIDLAMRGASPRQWMAGATGNVAVSVGPATVVNAKGKDGSLDRVAAAVNPFRNVQASTELKCAVVRIAIRNGVAHVDRTIALETRELGIAASGTLDFRNETLDLAVKPHMKQGIPIDLVKLADLVRVGGTFKSPAVHVDAAATAATVASIGAAVSTGGWSVVAQSLLKPAGGNANTCDVAAGRAPREAGQTAQQASPAKSAQQPVEQVTKALQGLFKR